MSISGRELMGLTDGFRSDAELTGSSTQSSPGRIPPSLNSYTRQINASAALHSGSRTQRKADRTRQHRTASPDVGDRPHCYLTRVLNSTCCWRQACAGGRQHPIAFSRPLEPETTKGRGPIYTALLVIPPPPSLCPTPGFLLSLGTLAR